MYRVRYCRGADLVIQLMRIRIFLKTEQIFILYFLKQYRLYKIKKIIYKVRRNAMNNEHKKLQFILRHTEVCDPFWTK